MAAGARSLDAPCPRGVEGYDAGSAKSAIASPQRDVRRLEDAGWRLDNVLFEGSTGRYVLHSNDHECKNGAPVLQV